MPRPQRPSFSGRLFAITGGAMFAASLAYFLLRYWQFGRPAGDEALAAVPAAAVNVALFTAFALHHSAFARTGLKAWVSSRVSDSLERAVYVWISTLLFVLMLWAWMPVPGEAWNVTGPGRWLLHGARIAGLLLTAIAAGAIDPLELAGIRQAFGWRLQRRDGLSTTGVYGLVRHPIYLGWILLVWSVPDMTGTRLVFAAISSLYLLIAIPLEEREMRRAMPSEYEAYARRVRSKIIPGLY